MATLASLKPLHRVGHICRNPTTLLVSHLSRSRPFRFCNVHCNLDRPNVVQLAAKARISLTIEEVEDFGPKIEQVIDWFGKLQGVNLENVEPAIRADTDGLSNLRPDTPRVFEDRLLAQIPSSQCQLLFYFKREAMIVAVPRLEEPYIRVPKILKENIE